MNSKMIIADMDGTLSESTLPIDDEMASLLKKWLESHRFAVISGGIFQRLYTQIAAELPKDTRFENLFFLPANGSTFYSFSKGEWNQAYNEVLSPNEILTIHSAFEAVLKEIGFDSSHIYGELLSNREGQVTFAGLGQKAPLELKKEWDAHQEKRHHIVDLLKPHLPDFNVSIGGTTSIDITKKGVDKGYGIEKIKSYLNIETADIIFLGDALYPGGNDEPARRTGVECIKVENVADTKRILKELMDSRSSRE